MLTIIMAVCGLVIFFFGGMGFAYYLDNRQFIREIKQSKRYKAELEMESLRQKINKSREEIEELGSTYSALKSSNDGLETEINQLRVKNAKGNNLCDLLELLCADGVDKLRNKINIMTNARP